MIIFTNIEKIFINIQKRFEFGKNNDVCIVSDPHPRRNSAEKLKSFLRKRKKIKRKKLLIADAVVSSRIISCEWQPNSLSKNFNQIKIVSERLVIR